MKKYLIVLAAAIVALASCKPSEQSGSKYTKISFKETSMELAVGETAKLRVLYEPTTLEAPVCEWSSSDTAIVSVDQNGNIEAKKYGEANITATYGEGESALKAVCKVSVLAYEATWGPNATVYYFPSTKSEKPVSDTTIVYKSESTGNSYTCKLYSVELCILTDVFIPEDEDGAGDYIFVTTSIPFIESSTSGKYIGEPYDLAFRIAEDFNNLDFGAQAGSIDPAIIGPVWQSYFEAIDAQQQPSFDADTYLTGAKGAHLRAAVISSEGSISYYPWFDAIITAGYYQTLYDAETEELTPDYELKVDWCAGALATGLALNAEATSYSEAIAQPYTLDLVSYIYVAGEHGQPYEAASPKKIRAKKDTKGMINLGKVEKLELVKYKEAK